MMRIRLFTIPNILTLLNLVCGSLALIEIILNANYTHAFILVILAGIFDFFDGMVARLLGQYSAIGGELDSLADMVSFGLVPSMAMFSLFNQCEKIIDNTTWSEWGCYITLIIVCFSALRLAKFNVDSEQKMVFIGLPTPANGLMCLSIAALYQMNMISLSGEAVIAISIVMALLLIAPIKMLALKFKSFGWRENRIRYIFLAISALAIVALKAIAVPIVVVIYIVISIINNLSERGQKSINA